MPPIGGYALLYENGRSTSDLGVPSDAGGQGFTNGLRSAQLEEVTNRTVFAELSSGHVVTIVVPSQIAEDGTGLGMDAAGLQDYLGALGIPVAEQKTPATIVNAVTGDAGTPHYAEEFGLSDGEDGTPRDLPVIRGRGRSDLIDDYGPNTLIDIEMGETLEEDGTGSLSEGADGDAELSPSLPSGR